MSLASASFATLKNVTLVGMQVWQYSGSRLMWSLWDGDKMITLTEW
jgi:hypothetical protein